VSWTFVPSLIGIMLLMFGIVFIVEGNSSTGAVLLVLGVAFMALWAWMVKREARG
jgi:hypothetical protein